MIFLLSIAGIRPMKSQTLVLHHANGSTTNVELYTQPQVKFLNEKVLIISTVLDMEYPKEDVLCFTYKGTSSGIDRPSGNANVSQENGQIVFHGIQPDDKIAVYTAKGIRVPVRLTRSGNTATLPLSAIPAGVYLLNVNGRTSKFTKR